MGCCEGWKGSFSHSKELRVAPKNLRRLPLLAVLTGVAVILSGCASPQARRSAEKPGGVGLQMQSNNLAGILQYGLAF